MLRRVSKTAEINVSFLCVVFIHLISQESIMKSALVVVIDMELSIRELMCLILAEAKYQVISLQHPPVSISTHETGLIILDIGPNPTPSLEFYNRLRNDPATSNIPVMLTSTMDDLERLAEVWKADSFILKPFDIDDLIGKVRRLL